MSEFCSIPNFRTTEMDECRPTIGLSLRNHYFGTGLTYDTLFLVHKFRKKTYFVAVFLTGTSLCQTVQQPPITNSLVYRPNTRAAAVRVGLAYLIIPPLISTWVKKCEIWPRLSPKLMKLSE